MERKPWSTFEHVWQSLPVPRIGKSPKGYTAWRATAHDGSILRVIVANPTSQEGEWHLSISCVDDDRRPNRYPTWDEIAAARDKFLPDDIAFGMILPEAGHYVAVHDTTFHLHPMPPEWVLR